MAADRTGFRLHRSELAWGYVRASAWRLQDGLGVPDDAGTHLPIPVYDLGVPAHPYAPGIELRAPYRDEWFIGKLGPRQADRDHAYNATKRRILVPAAWATATG